MTKEIIRLGMTLVQHIPANVVDGLLVRLSNFVFGDLSKHGIVRPKLGPLLQKAKTGRSAVIDVGTISLIKNGTIKVSIFSHMKEILYVKFLLQFIQVCYSLQVLGNISKIEGKSVEFEGRKESTFDAIVFATGYKSTANTWLKVPISMLGLTMQIN